MRSHRPGVHDLLELQLLRPRERGNKSVPVIDEAFGSVGAAPTASESLRLATHARGSVISPNQRLVTLGVC
jgi:hypothetical protein